MISLGIDFGTSGCRGIVIDAQQQIIAQHRVDLPAPTLDGKRVSQDPTIWEAGLIELFKGLSQTIALDQIARIALDGTSGTVLLCDEQGKPLTNARMYNDADTDAGVACIKENAPAESGAHGATSGLAKLITLSKEVSSQCLAITQADWLRGIMTDDYSTTDENNALKLGYDPIKRNWPIWINNCLDTLTVKMPEVQAPGTQLGVVSEAFAARTGLNITTLVTTGTTDSIAACLATGALKSGEAVTTLGSTLVVKVISDTPVFEPSYGIYSHRLGDQWLVGGASNAGCAVLKDYFTQDQMDLMSQQLDPAQSLDLHFYPLRQTGERFPENDPDKQPRLSPRPVSDQAFFHAILEGLAEIERDAYQRLAECGAPFPSRILTTGGGSVNRAWTEMRQRIIGVNTETATQVEAAYGSALLAQKGIQHDQ